MSTNLLDLPQIPAGTTITISTGADWLDQFFVAEVGVNIAPFTVTGALTTSSETFAGAPGASLPHMLVEGYGVPAGATISAVGDDSITLSAAATISAPAATLTILPPPLDLTGISFSSEIRLSAASPAVLLACSTMLDTMTAGGAAGTFGWSVPAATLKAAPWPRQLATQGALSCVLDIIATDPSGAEVNLCAENGPIAVTVNLSVTR